MIDRPDHLKEIQFTAAQMCLESNLIYECSVSKCPENFRKFAQRVYWKKLRGIRESWIGDECELCYREMLGADLHHRTYEHIGHEYIDDVILLCAACHKHIHMAGQRKAGRNAG